MAADTEKYAMDYKKSLKEYFSLLKRYTGIFSSLLFVVLIYQVLVVAERFLFKIIIDDGTAFTEGVLSQPQFVESLLFVGLIYLVLFLGKPLTFWFRLQCLNVLDISLVADLKRKYFNHILHLDHHFHTSHRTGSLISRLIKGGRAMEAMTDVFAFNFSPLLFQLIVVTVSLAYFTLVPSLVVVGTAIAFVSWSIFIQYIQYSKAVAANAQEDKEKGHISDIFLNIDSIKYFGKEDHIKQGYYQETEETKRVFMHYWKDYKTMETGQQAIIALGTFFIVYFPLMDLLAGRITIGTLVFIYTTFSTLMGPLFGFVHGIRNFYRALADFDALFYYGTFSNSIKDKSNKKLDITEGNIHFDTLTFRYKRRYIFKDFNLAIKKHQKVALVGHSGSGKTTLIKLLYRLYDVEQGQILIDNTPTTSVQQESLRGAMSIVPQECVLFDDTLYNNIKFSQPTATRKEVMKAMKQAQLLDFVKQLPEQEQTIVGERGVKLSGGEKQRVSIARAILANKKVLVLDEATSSLDSETEHAIQKALQTLMKGRTTIIIAHRLSTIMQADQIVVLKKGQIVQQGTHRQLIRKEGEYKKLWNLQKGGYIA